MRRAVWRAHRHGRWTSTPSSSVSACPLTPRASCPQSRSGRATASVTTAEMSAPTAASVRRGSGGNAAKTVSVRLYSIPGYATSVHTVYCSIFTSLL